MVINNTVKTYKVSDYVIDLRQRTVTQKGRPINLSKKSFDILAVLLQQPGQLVTKDQLMSEVWPDKFITDSTLNKQIERLRKSLYPKASKETIFKTVRGKGFMLEASVQENIVNLTTTSIPKKPFRSLMIIGLIVVLAYFTYQKNKNIPGKTNKSKIDNPKLIFSNPVNIAIVPAKKSDDWLNIGGLNYLTNELNKLQQVNSIKPRSEWFDSGNSKKLFIDIAKYDGIDYVVSVNNYQKDGAFYSDLQIRQKNQILASKQLKNNTIGHLFKDINKWVQEEIKINSGTNKSELQNISNYAFESFLKGDSHNTNQEYEKAIHFFETTINEYPKFFPAWLGLAFSHSEIGNLDKAIATIITLENLNDFDKKLLLPLYNVKVRTLIYQGAYKEAKNLNEKAMALANKKGGLLEKITILNNKSLLFDRSELYASEDSLKDLLLELNLVKKHNPLPQAIARVQINIAIHFRLIGNPEQAVKYLKEAANTYAKYKMHSGTLQTHRVMGDIYYGLAQPEKAFIELEKAQAIISEVDGYNALAFYYMSRAWNFLELGKFSKVLEYKSILDNLSLKHNVTTFQIYFDMFVVEIHKAKKEYKKATTEVNKLLNIVENKPHPDMQALARLIYYDIYLSIYVNTHDDFLLKLIDYQTKYPELAQQMELEFKIVKNIEAAKYSFNSVAIEKLSDIFNNQVEQRQFLTALFIGYEVLDIYYKNDMHAYQEYLATLEELTSFKYPLMKYKAKLFAYKKEFLNATLLLQELKPKSNEYWSENDQLLLEEYQQQTQNINKLNN